MNRPVFLFMLLSIVGSCGKANDEKEPQDNYIMHDDFFYYRFSDDGKSYLTPCNDEFYLIIKTENLDAALDELHDREFQITTDPRRLVYHYADEFSPVQDLCDCSYLCVKGSGDIDDLDGVVYSHHLYYGKNNVLVGKSNLFSVEYDSQNPESQIELSLQYAKKHNIAPIDIYRDLCWITFACTNASSGNPVELSNWFVEVGGFPSAAPEYSEVSLD